MNELQKKLLYILEQVDNCCDELGIKYFLDGGTLLGAVMEQNLLSSTHAILREYMKGYS